MKYVVLVLITFALACTAGKKNTTQPPEADRLRFDESFDPVSLNDDDIIIGNKEVKSSGSLDRTNTNAVVRSTVKEVDGFRVQLLATKNFEMASLVEQEATNKFAESGQKTYLIFEEPLYKIRIGDFTDRETAEEFRKLARSQGYRQAFIVRSKVLPVRSEDNNAANLQ